MNRASAEAIATKIREVWGGTGPTVNVWTDELEPLNETTARAALNRLKYTSERAPSIAKFFATYNEIRKESGAPEPPPCLTCDGVGWLTAPDLVVKGHRYSQVDRCLVCGGSGKAKTNDLEGAA